MLFFISYYKFILFIGKHNPVLFLKISGRYLKILKYTAIVVNSVKIQCLAFQIDWTDN